MRCALWPVFLGLADLPFADLAHRRAQGKTRPLGLRCGEHLYKALVVDLSNLVFRHVAKALLVCCPCQGYLISGYKQNVSSWEAGVLARKCALVMAASIFPVSYSPLLFLATELVILAASLTIHAYMQPYEDDFLNRIELSTLVASVAATLCSIIITLQPVQWTLDLGFCSPVLAILVMSLLMPFLFLAVVFFRDGLASRPPGSDLERTDTGQTAADSAKID